MTQSIQKQPGTLKQLLMHAEPSIRGVLPNHLDAERVIRIALLCVDRDPSGKLQQCTANSILGAVMQSSQLGLEIGGVTGHAYLVPFYDRQANGGQGAMVAQFIPGYRGLIQLVWRAAKIDIDADVVYERDDFDWARGTDARICHRQSLDDDRGLMRGVWALARFPDERTRFEVMSKSQVDAIRALSQTGSKPSSPWSKHYDEMAKKTAAKRLIKWLPVLSDELAQAVDIDNRVERGEAAGFDKVIDIEPGPSTKTPTGVEAVRAAGKAAKSPPPATVPAPSPEPVTEPPLPNGAMTDDEKVQALLDEVESSKRDSN